MSVLVSYGCLSVDQDYTIFGWIVVSADAPIAPRGDANRLRVAETNDWLQGRWVLYALTR